MGFSLFFEAKLLWKFYLFVYPVKKFQYFTEQHNLQQFGLLLLFVSLFFPIVPVVARGILACWLPVSASPTLKTLPVFFTVFDLLRFLYSNYYTFLFFNFILPYRMLDDLFWLAFSVVVMSKNHLDIKCYGLFLFIFFIDFLFIFA